MGRIYCEACGANWRSSGDGPEAQERHIDVPCVGESTEFKQRAQIAALTEKLAEAERAHDTTLRESQARGKDIADLTSALEYARADLSALRAELERKDAALKEWAAANDEAQTASYTDRELAAMNGLRAALQPKEPPCQTA